MNRNYFKKLILQAICLLTLSVFVPLKGAAQGPPPMAMPTKNNTQIIDKIIEITRHEAYFKEYCTKKVNEYAQANSWTAEKTEKTLNSIQFRYYDDTIYNSYASYTAAQLTQLLEALQVLLKDSKSHETFILTNSMMQNNLDGFVKSVIKGIYLTRD